MTFGAAVPPVEIYEGPTARNRLKGEAAAAVAAVLGEDVPLQLPGEAGVEGKSLGNVSRGRQDTNRTFYRRGGQFTAKSAARVRRVKISATRELF